MNNLVNIGEFAYLTGVSSHTIRFYEKKGIFKPYKIDENGYRQYNYQSYLDLMNIILFKDLGIPLNEIKDLKDTFTMTEYKSFISDSIKNIDEEIKRLKQLKKYLLKQQKRTITSSQEVTFKIESYPQRTLYKLVDVDYESDFSLKQMYNKLHDNNIDPNEIGELNDLYIVKEENLIYCKEKSKKTYPLDTHIYDEGEYLVYNTIISDSTFINEVNKLYNYISDNNYIYESELLSIMDPVSIVDTDGFYNIEFQIKVSKY